MWRKSLLPEKQKIIMQKENKKYPYEVEYAPWNIWIWTSKNEGHWKVNEEKQSTPSPEEKINAFPFLSDTDTNNVIDAAFPSPDTQKKTIGTIEDYLKEINTNGSMQYTDGGDVCMFEERYFANIRQAYSAGQASLLTEILEKKEWTNAIPIREGHESSESIVYEDDILAIGKKYGL